MTDVMMTKPRQRVTWTAAERASWLELFDKSGKTAVDFCRDNDLAPATLSYWRSQLNGSESSEEELIEVPMQNFVPASAAAVTVELPSGLRFEVPVGLDTAWFGHLLQSIVSAKV